MMVKSEPTRKTKNLVFMTTFFLLFFYFSIFSKSAVTYTFSGGRFGDNLVAYLHAKYVAFKYDLDFLYKPFEYSSELELDRLETIRYTEACVKKFTKIIKIFGINTLKIDKNANYLYIIPYFPEFIQEVQNIKNVYAKTYFAVDWNDKDFYRELTRLIKPQKELEKILIPSGVTSIALHVRKGGDFIGDPPLKFDSAYKNKIQKFKFYADTNEPLKFPPDSFYIDQLKMVARTVKGPLYVHIFTDDSNPKRIATLYEKELAQEELNNIFFSFRESGNIHCSNVLEDFFALTQFDIIIRPNSNFSMLAFKLKNKGMEIAPKKAHLVNKALLIYQVEINYRSLLNCSRKQ